MIKLTAGTATSVILPLHDIDGQLQEWIDTHYSTEFMRIMAPPSSLYTRRGSNLPFPNYAPLPAPKINQLVLPTGASRWGYTLLLATEKQKNDIYAGQSSTGFMTLHWSAPLVGDLDQNGAPVTETTSETNRTVKLLVHCLPPRPVTPRGRLKDDGTTSAPSVSRRIENLGNNATPEASDLFIIPVVDARYFLQFLDVGEMSAETFTSDSGSFTDTFDGTTQTSAEKIYTYLIGKIPSLFAPSPLTGFVKCDDISVKYTIPPSFAAENDYENLGAVLDAFCWSHGLAFVPVPSQEYKPSSGAVERYAFAVVSVDESNMLYRGNNLAPENHGSIRGFGGIGKSGRSGSPTAGLYSTYEGGKKFCGMPVLIAGGDSYRRQTGTIMEGTPLPAQVQVYDQGTWQARGAPTDFAKWPAKSSGVAVTKTLGSTIASIRTEWSATLTTAQIDQIASDYYYRYLWQFDYTFLGVQPWQQTAYDDYVVYSMSQHNGMYNAFTRAISIPVNTYSDSVAVSGSGGGASATGCRCVCITRGDIVVNGVETTSQWTVSTGEIVFEQVNGSIIVPRGEYTLTWDAANAKWTIDIGSLLIAKYLNGTDATSATTMDGEIKMVWASAGAAPVLSVCVDGTVPSGS